MDPAKDITSVAGLKGKPMSPDEFLVVNEQRQKIRESNGDPPAYVNFNNAATKFLLDQVFYLSSQVILLRLLI